MTWHTQDVGPSQRVDTQSLRLRIRARLIVVPRPSRSAGKVIVQVARGAGRQVGLTALCAAAGRIARGHAVGRWFARIAPGPVGGVCIDVVADVACELPALISGRLSPRAFARQVLLALAAALAAALVAAIAGSLCLTTYPVAQAAFIALVGWAAGELVRAGLRRLVAPQPLPSL